MNGSDNIINVLDFLKNTPVIVNKSRDEIQELFNKLCLLEFNDENIIHSALTKEEYLILKELGFENLSTFSGNFYDLDNLPDIPMKVEDLEDGELYATKEYVKSYIRPVPTKTSDLINDMKYIREEDIPYIPTKVSELSNDKGYLTEIDIAFPEVLSAFKNDVGYVRHEEVPHYIRTSDIGITFGDSFEQGLLEIARLNPKPNNIYRCVCQDYELMSMFNGSIKPYSCFLEIRILENLFIEEDNCNTLTMEAKLINLETDPYIYINVFVISRDESSEVRLIEQLPKWDTIINVNADWNEEDQLSDAYIKNKPMIPYNIEQLEGIENLVNKEYFEENIPKEISKLDDAYLYALKADIPTRVTQLEDWTNFVTRKTLENIIKEQGNIIDISQEDLQVLKDMINNGLI